MINWRNGRAAFVGASKYLINGFFSYAHSITSETPIEIPPECVFGVECRIDTTTLSVRSTISPRGLSVKCKIDTVTGVESRIDSDGLSVRCKIDHNGLSVESRLCL